MKLELYIMVSMDGFGAAWLAPSMDELLLQYPHVSGQICANVASCCPLASKAEAVLFNPNNSRRSDSVLVMAEPVLDRIVERGNEHIVLVEHCLTAAISGCKMTTSCKGDV